jgi:hypothetical protein
MPACGFHYTPLFGQDKSNQECDISLKIPVMDGTDKNLRISIVLLIFLEIKDLPKPIQTSNS